MYYQATVTISQPGKNGGTKKEREQYLVNAVSVTDAEKKVTEKFTGVTLDWEVSLVKQSNIIEVID
jgi:hypothetical protein